MILCQKYPTISVVMSVYNGERYLGKAIDSILHQTFRDFEFIIIDDGSTDATRDILVRYQKIDNRIRFFSQKNQGLVVSLNMACHLAKGQYIARMDADDISLPYRFEKQATYLKQNPQIGVLGSWVHVIDENGSVKSTLCFPSSPSLIGWFLFFRSCIAHSSVFIRRDILKKVGFYHPEAIHVEDYDLWVRLNNTTQIANLSEPLLMYRMWEGSVCAKNYILQQENVARLILSPMISSFLRIDMPVKSAIVLRNMVKGRYPKDLNQIMFLITLIIRLYQAYLMNNTLKKTDLMTISSDARSKLLVLARLAIKISFLKGFMAFYHALKLELDARIRIIFSLLIELYPYRNK